MLSIQERIDFYKGRNLRNNNKFELNYNDSDKYIEYNNLKIKFFKNAMI